MRALSAVIGTVGLAYLPCKRISFYMPQTISPSESLRTNGADSFAKTLCESAIMIKLLLMMMMMMILLNLEMFHDDHFDKLFIWGYMYTQNQHLVLSIAITKLPQVAHKKQYDKFYL